MLQKVGGDKSLSNYLSSALRSGEMASLSSI